LAQPRGVGRGRKRFGQHFLEPAWVQKVVRAIAPEADERFIEIGPGGGALTRPLAARAARVTAYEIDRDLAATLDTTSPPNLAVVEGDFLNVTVQDLQAALAVGSPPLSGPVRVAGNLPYNVASVILFKLLDAFSAGIPMVDATLMLQKEVADRLLAQPGTRQYGVLSVLVRHRAAVSRLLVLPPGAFRPPPRVLSTLVRLRFHAPDPAVLDPGIFTSLVQAVFTRRRKTVANALLAFPGSRRITPADALARAGLDGGRRPEALAIGEMARLADVYASDSARAVL
jgi:16S rRNA (adenine1518-N6/adenine1519-N6)-dimethyltransferase